MDYKINKMKRYHLTANIIQRSAWIPLRLLFKIFANLEVSGVKQVRKISSAAIVASNHTNELDPLVIVACLPFLSRQLPLIFVSREKVFYSESGWLKHIYGGLFFSLMGAFQAYAGLNNYAKALVHHLEALACSKTVCIFPVGRKHTAADLHEAKGGVMYLAAATDLPILPVKIEGIDKMGMRDFFSKRRKMRVTFGEPLSWQDLMERKADRINYDRNDYEQAARLLMRRIDVLNSGC